MDKLWHDKAWNDYTKWQSQDKKTLEKINSLVKEIERSRGKGIGHAEFLRGDLSGWSSARIDHANRLIYRIKDDKLHILSCRGHYKQ